MSLRRSIGDIVKLLDSDDKNPYLAQIVPHGRGTEPEDCYLNCGDSNCKEWPVLHVIGSENKPTGERIFHVSECDMATPSVQHK